MNLPLTLLRGSALLLGLLLLQPALGNAQIAGASENEDRFGSALAAGDFDGDGRSDLAVGVPEEDVGGIEDAGTVNVIYGTGGGLAFADNQQWYQDTPDIIGIPEAFDRFGAALAAGDFNGDGRDDLAIGVPYENVGTVGNAGAVNVIYGSAVGLQTAFNQIWRQDDLTYTAPEADDHFGASLAAGDFNGDGYHDLVVGSPDEDISSINAAGVVHVIYGGPSGLSAAGNEAWYRSLAGHGASITFDNFGFALTAGDFSDDGFDDFAVGVVGYDAGGTTNAGGVIAFYGSAGGTTAGNTFWSQATPGINGTPGSGDQFGFALASADFDADGHADLAVGVPFEDVGGAGDSGAVNVIYGAGGGLSAADNQLFTQASTGIGSVSEADDRFGWSLAAGPLNVGAFADLAVGTYGEAVGSLAGAGAVVVIAGTGSGLDPTLQSRTWRQGREGALDRAEAGDRFGAALAIGAFDGGIGHLAVGVPDEDVDGDTDAGAVNVLTRALNDGVDVEGSLWYQGLDVDVAATPLDPPAPVVVARGERIRFRITVRRYPGSSGNMDYWADAVFPNGSESGPYLGPGAVQVPPDATGSGTFRQRVAGNAPLGTYLYVVKVGFYPDEVLASAVFTITVTASEGADGEPLAARAAGDGALDWLATDDRGRPLTEGTPVAWVIEGGTEDAAEAPAAASTPDGLPSGPALHVPYPNPSRGRVTLGFSLPERAPVRLAVYDALGRSVAVLVDDVRAAGTHAVALDAAALPSGTYLVRLQAGGAVQTQRVTLVR